MGSVETGDVPVVEQLGLLLSSLRFMPAGARVILETGVDSVESSAVGKGEIVIVFLVRVFFWYRGVISGTGMGADGATSGEFECGIEAPRDDIADSEGLPI